MTVRRALLIVLTMLLLASLACNLAREQVIEITATPDLIAAGGQVPGDPTGALVPTPNLARTLPTQAPQRDDNTYVVQGGDTFNVIASRYGIEPEELRTLNPDLPDANVLELGDILNVPDMNIAAGPYLKLIPDSELVYSPAASDFSVAEFLADRESYLSTYSERSSYDDQVRSGPEIITTVATNYSVNPRLLLALLEYRGGWLSQPQASSSAERYPFGLVDDGLQGLEDQTIAMANALNQGYYAWKYRGDIPVQPMVLSDGTRLVLDATLNPGTIGVQYALGIYNTYERWQTDVSATGFYQTYVSLFGNPFAYTIDPLVPRDLQQPDLTLPFAPGEIWRYSGGPHGGYNTGSAWAAIDFAPPDLPDDYPVTSSCYLSPYAVIASAPGVVVRSADGQVVLDLDGDGNEHTGWTLLYMHVDQQNRVQVGDQLQTGDRIGQPSCEGGFSNGTHLHFARRYNGEWIPAECTDCAPDVTAPPFVLSGWVVAKLPGQPYAEYQGTITNLALAAADPYYEASIAEASRLEDINLVSW
ncbi:MAG: peptidoglycan DD-metalloendopeptidase family protein [Chloroflexi bacterium]|nr:peptidoglycan DD-metalloendopeptidase family protein [Chloroflexota bacterium]